MVNFVQYLSVLDGLNEKLRIYYYNGEYFKGRTIKTILWSNKKHLSLNEESINMLVLTLRTDNSQMVRNKSMR